jgi:hypothetical protein
MRLFAMWAGSSGGLAGILAWKKPEMQFVYVALDDWRTTIGEA